MKVMLDTNTCIAIIRQQPPRALNRFKAYSVGEIGISWMTLAELSAKPYPNDSPDYRKARTALLVEEIELRRQIERVARQVEAARS